MGRWGSGESIKLFRNSFKLIIKLPIFEIQISLLLPVIVLIMYFSCMLREFILIFISMILHELGHIIAAMFLKLRIYSVKFLPIGLSAEIERCAYGIWENVLLDLSGPAANVLLILPFTLVNSENFLYVKLFYPLIRSNIVLAFFNLIPVLPLDGGRILKVILTEKSGILYSQLKMKRISTIFAFLLIFLGLLQVTGNIYNFSILTIGIYIIFQLKSGYMEASLMNMKDIVYRRSRLLKKGIYPARDLVVLGSVKIIDILKSMDFDRFHIIYVLDDSLRIVKSFTEQEVMDLILKYDANITFEELMGME